MAEATGAPEINQLIVAAATGTVVLSQSELRRVLEHIAQVGFDPNAREQVRGRLAGMIWQGQTLRGRDRLPPDELHYLWHVVKRGEWPAGTTLAGYSESVRQVILDPASGVFTSRYQGALQVGIVRSSDDLRGPRDFAWLLVEYRVITGHWTTAYQLPSITLELQNERRGDVRWLRPPQRIVA